MSVRAIKARIVCDQHALEQLWRTHMVFNNRLTPLIHTLFKMRRGEVGDNAELRQLYTDIGHFITGYDAQQADYLLNAISMNRKTWVCSDPNRFKKSVKIGNRDGTTREIFLKDWAERAIQLSKSKQLVFDKDDLHGDLPACMRQVIGRETVAIISGHDELTSIWLKEHKDWLKKKALWEAEPENQKYLAIRPVFEKFEQEIGGTLRKRRGRWHAYLDFLRANPALAAWRGGESIVHTLDDPALKRIQKARPSKKRSVEAEEFWKVNPELLALHRLHGFYEREFVRRGKTKRNRDGFKHRPTFTEPHPINHPRWFVFNAPQTNPSGWRNLELPKSPLEMGSVELSLLTADKKDGQYPSAFIPIRFKADPRLSDFKPTTVQSKMTKGKNKGNEKDKAAYVWHDRHLHISDRPATIGGIKLLFDIRPDGLPKSAFLIFTCNVTSIPLTLLAKETKSEFSEELTARGKKKFKGRKIPPGLVSLAVDIGIRHIGFASLAKWDGQNIDLLRARNIRIDTLNNGSPDLDQLARHKRRLRRLRGMRGDPIKGEASHVELQQHIDHMAEDRFKKAARAIINLALNSQAEIDKKSGQSYPRADVLILENLENLIPDAEKERGINRALISFNRGQLVDRVRQLADDVGLKVFEISPVGTSQVCHKCGSLGRRYSIRREAKEKGEASKPVIHFGPTESLFACPKCSANKEGKEHLPFTCNSDFNAAVNLQRRFFIGEHALKDFGTDKAKRAESIKIIDEKLRPRLENLHELSAPIETPW